jgi:NitT/TauT family transport system substrate-binding protein
MNKINKKMIIVSLFVILIGIVIFGCTTKESITGRAISNNLEKVSVRLPIPVQDATMTPYFTTLDKGFYQEEGLDVTLNLASSETNPVKMVSVGADQIGVLGGPDTLLIARSKGLPLVAVAVLHRNSDFPVLMTLKNSGLTKVEELDGKKVGFFYGHISTDIIKYLLSKNNIKYEEVNVGMDFNQLITGKIDAQWAFKTHGPVNLKAKGIDLNIISPRDYGINTHGLTFFTTEEMIEENPELIEAWLRATFRGLRYMKENPDDALQSVLSRDPQLTLELERKKLDEYMALLSDSEEYPLGYMDHQMFKETYDRLNEEGLLKEEFDVNDAFTTEFLQNIHEKSIS